MIAENKLAADIDAASYRAQYDNEVKKLLSHKIILAWILQSCTSEFRDVPIAEIEKCIEGTPEIGTKAVHRDEGKDIITGMNNEDSSVYEQTIFFDIRFSAIHPEAGKIQMIINVEVQRDANTGYPLEKRIIYYLSRLISAQYGPVFDHARYGDIRKVYSIWIVPNPAEYRRNSIWKMSFSGEDMVGQYHGRPKDYDLMTGIIINLNSEKERSDVKIIKLLDVLLSENRAPEEKKKILSEEFDIPYTEEIEQEVLNMCNLSQGIYEKGYDTGRIQEAVVIYREELNLSDGEIIKKLQKKFQITEEQAREFVLQAVLS